METLICDIRSYLHRFDKKDMSSTDTYMQHLNNANSLLWFYVAATESTFNRRNPPLTTPIRFWGFMLLQKVHLIIEAHHRRS